MREEKDIKRFLLPYQSILKITKTNEIRDTVPFEPYVTKSVGLSWGIYEYHCEGNTRVVDKIYQYVTKTGIPTGIIKDNISTDSDYIPNQLNSTFCTI